MKVCCLPSLPPVDQFKIRQFLDLAGCEYVLSHANRRVWCDNWPRNDVRRHDNDVNGRMINSSKKLLESKVREIFGYGYAIDPSKHRGPALEKRNWHALHPQVIQCPTKPDRRFFYAELLYGIEWRVAVFSGVLVCTYTERQRGLDGLPSPRRVTGSSHYNVPWEGVMAKSERVKLLALCRALGLDYGEFDIIRHTDGRFCPIDVNPSPSPPSPHSFISTDFARIIPLEAELFKNEVL